MHSTLGVPRSMCIAIFRIFSLFCTNEFLSPRPSTYFTGLSVKKYFRILFIRIIPTEERLVNISLEKNIDTFFIRVNRIKRVLC